MKKFWLYIIISIAFVPFLAKGWAESPAEILKKEKKVLPEPVFSLFYAVKDSLDYGISVGQTKEIHPKEKLSDYTRVTKKLLQDVEKPYAIISYEVHGTDYILIVENKADPKIKFKATRTEKFKLTEKGWLSLGGYHYY